MRRFFLCLLLLLGMPLSAQTPPEAVSQFEFVVGDWIIDSSRDLNGLTDDEPNWQQAEGVSHIQPHLNDYAFLENWVTVRGDDLAEGIMLRAVRDARFEPWDIIWSESNTNAIHFASGEFDDAGNFETRWFDGERNWQMTVTDITDESFVVTYGISSNRREPYDPIWILNYQRATPEAAAEKEAEIRARAEMPPPPEEIQGFAFWMGDWDITAYSPIYEEESRPAQDRVGWVNGGHAFTEHWVALWSPDVTTAPPFESFSLSIFNTDTQVFNNIWWQTGTSGAQIFDGGTCEGDGAEKRCRLAGVFHNITEESFDWYIGSEDNPSWRLEFFRKSE